MRNRTAHSRTAPPAAPTAMPAMTPLESDSELPPFDPEPELEPALDPVCVAPAAALVVPPFPTRRVVVAGGTPPGCGAVMDERKAE